VPQYAWSDCREIVRDEVLGLVGACQAVLSDTLIGIYLHGSLASGCFNPVCSDIDILVLCRESAAVVQKRRLAEHLLANSTHPVPIEISFLRPSDIQPWKHPAPYDWHYSESHRERIEQDLTTGQWRSWSNDGQVDSDLAAHITMLGHSGVALMGPQIPLVFPSVPESDFRAAILGDFEWAAERVGQMPVYAVLNVCRTLLFVKNGTIHSKQEAGELAVAFVQEEYRRLVNSALEAYSGSGHMPSLAQDNVSSFLVYARKIVGQA
jgi:predicted nucleotidyltransferase